MFNNTIYDVATTSSDEDSNSETNCQLPMNVQSSILTKILWNPFGLVGARERPISEPSVSNGSSLISSSPSFSHNAEVLEQPYVSLGRGKKFKLNKHLAKLEKSNDPWNNPIRRRAKALKGIGGLGNKSQHNQEENKKIEKSFISSIEDLRTSKVGPRLKTGINRQLTNYRVKSKDKYEERPGLRSRGTVRSLIIRIFVITFGIALFVVSITSLTDNIYPCINKKYSSSAKDVSPKKCIKIANVFRNTLLLIISMFSVITNSFGIVDDLMFRYGRNSSKKTLKFVK
ncbi:hypothetical protein [Candidatus Ichthyocystis sparus]|nr:hypothetical protein [Candidatus Ichthyocystis sparus]